MKANLLIHNSSSANNQIILKNLFAGMNCYYISIEKNIKYLLITFVLCMDLEIITFQLPLLWFE